MGVKYRENANEPWREIEMLRGPQGIQGIQGERGEPGAGLMISGSVATYDDLPVNLTLADAGEAYFVEADGKLYIWSGTAWPANGEGSQFKGDKGDPGKDGYTPVKGVDYFDGEDGYTPVKGKDYFDGVAGKDGVSATHIWNGTTLIITSASGTSSADLKGEKGDTGEVDYSRLDGYLSKAVYDPQGKAQDVFAYADTKLDKAGGTMTGPISLNPSTAYIGVRDGSVNTFTNPKLFNIYGSSTVGTIAINVGKENCFLALYFSVSSYNMVMDLKFSGYTYTSQGFFHSPMVGGSFNGFGNYANVSSRFRAAVDNEGNRYFLIGDVDTNWGGYLRGAVTTLIRMGGTGVPDVDIQFMTDESHITWQQELPLRSSLPVEVDLFNKVVPVEKGGTGAASAADARTALGVPSTDEMNTAISEATTGFVDTETMNTAISAATANAVTTTEMNTAIANAIGTALEASY